MRLFISTVFWLILFPWHAKAQTSLGVEGGSGILIKSTKKIYGNRDKHFYTHSVIAAALFVQTQKDRIVNFGAQLSYVHRDFSWMDGPKYGTSYVNSYLYVTPYFDLSYDRHRYFHIQVMAPVGVLTSGRDRELAPIYDIRGNILRDTAITTTESISSINARIGGSIYALIPLRKDLHVLGKVEYTISANQLSTNSGFQVNPSDLLFKLGLSYTIHR